MVKAELQHPLDANKFKTGDLFYLKTSEDWQNADCTVRTRSLIVGTVTRLDRPGKGTELSVRFQAMPCAESETILTTPLLVGLAAKPQAAPDGLQRLMSAGAEDAALFSLFNPTPPASLHLATPPDNKPLPRSLFSWGGKEAEGTIRTGDVKGFRNVKMQLPQGTPETKLIAAKSLYLDAGTVFMLTMVVVPAAGSQQETHRLTTAKAEDASHTLPKGSSGGKNQIPAVAVKEVEPVEVCAAGGCVQAVTGEGNGGSTSAMWSRSLEGLGFLPRLNRMIPGLGKGLDDDAAVAFLGEDQVLFAFNTHRLLVRTAGEAAAGQRPQSVRAVVFSRKDGRLVKVEDWAVSNDAGPFLWSLGNGRVLAHVGGELVQLADGLEVKERYRLPGPLVFVSTATGDGPLLVATVKERHQPGEHASLAGSLRRGELLDEDYELTALDAKLTVSGSKTVGAEPLRPALLANAMVSIKPIRSGVRYNVEERRWTGERKSLASVASACEVQAITLAAKVLYLSGCDATNWLRGWYRLITPEGATLLKGRPGDTDILQQALSNQSGQRFMTVSTDFNADVYPGLNVAEREFKRLSLSVFDISTGKSLLQVQPAGGSALRQTAAISPLGEWVAVVSGSKLQVYGVAP